MVKTTATTLRDSVLSLPGVGPRTANDLRSLGIGTLSQLTEHLPTRHEHYGQITPLNRLVAEQTVLVKAKLQSIKSRRSFRRRLSIQDGLISDGTRSLAVTWFNQPYLEKIEPGTPLLLRGQTKLYKGQLSLVSPEIIKDPDILSGKQKLQPVYPLAGKLTTKQLRYWEKIALSLVKPRADLLPADLKAKHELIDRSQALKEMHFPTDELKLAEAHKRLAFEELLLLSLYVLRERQALKHYAAQPVAQNDELMQQFVASLPFKLTQAQRKAAWQIIKDLSQNYPMNRLLEGDVGSGKTLVASMAMLSVAKQDGQAVLLAPTVVLARQHAITLRKDLAGLGLGAALYTGTTAEDEQGEEIPRADFLKALKRGQFKVIVGTHAVLKPKVEFKNLELFVVDEQHRFGVKQRQLLKTKVRRPGHLPHLLSMTATPIPRSLALTLYGDLDLSVLDEKPPGRQEITTKIVRPKEIKKVYQDILNRAKQGEQAFVMFPLINESEHIEAKAVEAELAGLKKELRGLKVGMLHGRMSDPEKTDILRQFKAGDFDVLAATPVIEVGIDIPAATTMLIMSADRFGLAQLHQLRGRVGRDEKPGVCWLCPDQANQKTRDRLQLLTETNDGFKLAEADLEMRGPGDVFGTKQHGQVTFKHATVFDARILAAAKEEAANLLNIDKTLAKWPLLHKQVSRVATRLHLE